MKIHYTNVLAIVVMIFVQALTHRHDVEMVVEPDAGVVAERFGSLSQLTYTQFNSQLRRNKENTYTSVSLLANELVLECGVCGECHRDRPRRVVRA